MVNVPDLPANSFASPAGDRTWWWRLIDSGGGAVEVDAEYADKRFSSQADAESWIGEFWSDLATRGVESVILVDVERDVYGPMSLQP
jgi:hypothetical protein